MPRSPRLLVPLATTVLLVGCSEPSARDALELTAAGLGDVLNGRLTLTIRPSGGDGIAVERTIGVSDAPAGAKGQAVAGDAAAVDPVALTALSIRAWIDRPILRTGDEVDGLPTERITGSVDPREALADLFSLARRLGATVPHLREGDLRMLERAAREARVEIVTSVEGRMLQGLRVDISFRRAAVRDVRRVLGPLGGDDLAIALEIGSGRGAGGSGDVAAEPAAVAGEA
jgi:hypothetical protein